MSIVLLFEQLLNGLQFGLMLFLLSIGVTLIFGVMGLVNIAHGSLFMLGAYIGFTVADRWGFAMGVFAGLAGAALAGLAMEALVMRRLYHRDHLDQVLGTFGLMLVCNELVVLVWGREPLMAPMPGWLSGSVLLFGDLQYPAYRIAISAVAVVAGLGVYALVGRTRVGMLIRAGADKRTMVEALGVNIDALFCAVFVLGAALAALAGLMMGPLITLESGVGEPLLILALAVIIVGGAGSLKGCLAASLLIGVMDTLARAYMSTLGGGGRAAAGMAVYWLMIGVLLLRPRGLFVR
ncbi:branched-chain amino acid ABC transporter permease [Aquabacterium sp. J223]|uniref:branched-chain amino acid ABC transporter permease n=1 Tax=Aquabacterium sp. J223 TaxID=2898431 RepID=UPI0021ADF566|nr:branched-chain amino acid ABC transporter permease [Aquabacterium sp. J223]UUX95282.1 branched-chain amino acid ABC transporter permease [Aquabacterium sp. J223]